MIIEALNEGGKQLLKRALTWRDVRELRGGNSTGFDQEPPGSISLSFSALFAMMNIPAQHIRRVAIFAPDLYHVVIEEQMFSMLDDARIVVDMLQGSASGEQPLVRCVEFPRHHEMHSVSAPDRLRLEIAPAPITPATLHFHFPNASALASTIVSGPSEPLAINVGALLGRFNAAAEPCSLLSGDGLLRSCYPMIFSPDTTLVMNACGECDLIGADVPKGMRIRNIFCLRIRERFLFLRPLRSGEEQLWQTKLLEPALQAALPMLPRIMQTHFHENCRAANTTQLPPNMKTRMLSRLILESGAEDMVRNRVDVQFR